VAKHLGEAVGKVRQTEHKQLRTKGDQRLKDTKYEATRSRLPPMVEKAKMLKSHLANILYFHCGDLDLLPQPT